MNSATEISPAKTEGWLAAAALLRCPKCSGQVTYESSELLTCSTCAARFAIVNDVLHLNSEYVGNNAIAAEYYNSRLWPKFRFWESMAYLPRGGERKARREVLRHLPELTGTRLLDVAIGDGRNLPLIPTECDVFGVDISRVLLEKCRHDYMDRQLHLIIGQAEALPFPDASFDNLFSLGAINHVNDPGQALREMARVVKPGGTIVVADEVPDLPNRQIAHKLGLPKLQRWILSKVFFLGPMADVILQHTNLKLEPLAAAAFSQWKIHPIWGGLGYCIVGKA